MKLALSTRIVLGVIALHAIVLPVLYYGLDFVVRRSHADMFIQHVRTLSRNLADELEVGNALDSRQRLLGMLDLAVLGGDGVYAELIDNGEHVVSKLNASDVRWPGRQDFAFNLDGDGVYFIELPITRPGHFAELRLGFDEHPSTTQIQLTMRQTFLVLAAYLGIAVTVAAGWGYHLSRPVVRLQRISQQIAGGDYAQSLRVRTGVREFHNLGNDLDTMREELVGINERLRADGVERERAVESQRKLEDRLRHRQRLETVGTLAGGIAHEFNNILQPIVLFTESALADSPDHTSVHQDLREVLASAFRAREVVDKILTFSRLEVTTALEEIDLEPVLREALRLYGALIPPSVDLRTELRGPYPLVKADAALTIQVVMNLCTNAYRALGGAQGVVTVGLSRCQDPVSLGSSTPGELVVLSVTDTGRGMDAATAERIFEPFFTTGELGAGTGLGLSVVHGIVESFGATISVDTAVGRGTTVSISFPVANQSLVGGLSTEPPPGVQS